MKRTNRYRVLCFLLLLLPLGMQAQRLSQQSRISILTISPGSELYSRFGHSGIRVTDPVLGIDWVYDYGVFDFNTPNFYWKFAQGKLNYMLSLEEFERFQRKYQYYQRSYREQVLQLTLPQKQAVFDFLTQNYLPENRYYLYDFFFDNCASRLKDVMQNALGSQVVFDETPPENHMSFRQLTDLYLTYSPWGDLGIDLALGLPTDRIANTLEYMFLPDYVYEGFAKASVLINDEYVPLVVASATLYEGITFDDPVFFHPVWIFWVVGLFVLWITWNDFQLKRRSNWLDLLLFLVAGLAGLLIVFLWFFTDHTATANNLNILWALPTHFFMCYFFFKKKKPPFVFWYFTVAGLIGVVLLVAWKLLPQMLHTSMYPVVLALTVRCLFMYVFGISKFKLPFLEATPPLRR
jgi:hypothetical protein